MKELAITVALLGALAGCSGDKDFVVIDAGRSGNGSGAGGITEMELTDNAWQSVIRSGDTGTDTTVSGFALFHRSGQTFLYWNEQVGANYNVYRHNVPITSANLNSATLLTGRWGPLDQDTSVNQYGAAVVPQNFVINDLSAPLGDGQGLFVHTTQNGQQGAAYYAVTVVDRGTESRTIITGQNSSSQPVSENVSTPRPVLTQSVNGGKGRLYTQYMDYANWNPTLNGYGFNFAVALPSDYNGAQAYPLRLELHAYGSSLTFPEQTEYNWPVIQLFTFDPGSSAGTTNTWWYGHSADHNYKTQGSVPGTGNVENFTEQRVMAAVDYVINDSELNVDSELVHAYGHSMGGSGALSLGMRYPSVFAGIYASEPMTNYTADTEFQQEFVRLWGEPSANLPIVNNGPSSTDISEYGVGGSQPTQVWNWMNHQEQLRRRRADRFAYLMMDHGKADTIIPWQSQGQPMPQTFADARVGFSAGGLGGKTHSWLSFSSVVRSVFGFGYGDENGWLYPRSLSFPAIHNASGSGSLQPGNTGDDLYNTNIEWSTPRNNFHQNIVDSSNRYEISLRSTASTQTAEITPRNTNSFKPASGVQCSWTAVNNNNNVMLGSGNATVDGSRLLTIPGVQLVIGIGTRLIINC